MGRTCGGEKVPTTNMGGGGGAILAAAVIGTGKAEHLRCCFNRRWSLRAVSNGNERKRRGLNIRGKENALGAYHRSVIVQPRSRLDCLSKEFRRHQERGWGGRARRG